MRCLHICNDFLGSKVHKNLYSYLDKLGIEQTIFVPFRNGQDRERNALSFINEKSRIFYSNKLKNYHKLFFSCKISFLIKNLEEQIDLNNLDVIYATTLFSDGSIALYLHKKYGIPYVVAIRSTDVDVFMRFRPDLNGLCNEILSNANRIIFISDSLKYKFEKKLSKDFLTRISSKFNTIYNGVGEFWHDNVSVKKEVIKGKVRVVYVGSLIRRKNVIRTIKSILQISKYKNIEFNIIGVGGVDSQKILKYSKNHPEVIKYLGPINEISLLSTELRNNHIFVMPSYRETFGLVYIEALSQGLPVLFAKNEGIDRMLTGIGESVDPFSIQSITTGINKISENYESYQPNKVNFQEFRWSNIAATYEAIFLDIIGKDK